MNFWLLIRRNLWFHRRALFSVWMGVVITAAILTGALGVGDSVRFSLREMAMARLGKIGFTLAPHERVFRAELAREMARSMKQNVAPALIIQGAANRPDGAGRANGVQVCGVDEAFWKLGGIVPQLGEGDVVVNERLASQLQAKVGDEIIVRVEKPSLLGRDAPLSKDEGAVTAMMLKVSAILPDSGFGRFSLQANQVPPYNAFAALETLQKTVEQPGRANQILVGGQAGQVEVEQMLLRHFALADTGAFWREIPKQNALELRTERVFLDPSLAKSAMARKGARPVVGYLVNAIKVGSRSVPYSMVAGVSGTPLPPGMTDDDVVLNDWAARDLQAKIGDRVTLKFWVMGPGRKLEERSAGFRLRAVVPLAGAARDPDLMPEFPGIAGKKSCRDWEPGVAVDVKRIRKTDEKYWDGYRGSPKAFLTIESARKLFGNRFGDFTAVRFPLNSDRAKLGNEILAGVPPAELGLNFVAVRKQALKAGAQSTDFGGLFVAFSFFLIVSALLLTGLLFALNAESRAREFGTLLALGFTSKFAQKVLLVEGLMLAVLGSVPGALLGVIYTRAVLGGLNGVWRGATGTAQLQFHLSTASLMAGVCGAVVIALFSIWLVARKQAGASARELLSGVGTRPATSDSVGRGGPRPYLALAAFGVAVAMVGYSFSLPANQQAGMVFGAGSLLLLAICLWSSRVLAQSPSALALTANSVALRNLRRRRGRSLAVIVLLACASFLIVAIGAFRTNPLDGEALRDRNSGTGGFALWMETALPIYQDLNVREAREKFGLAEGVSFVPLRLREGDDASCLNLNRAQTPRLWGVNPDELQHRKAFGTEWGALSNPKGVAVPVIGDENTVVWGLGLGVGSTLEFQDERGQPFKVIIAGLVKKTVLQGGLLMSEKNFLRHYPSAGGYRAFLVDAPAPDVTKTAEELSQALQDYGAEVTLAARRLAQFQQVENTYLAIFQVLGALGLLLGSAGLGVVVARNVLERRGELALLRAVGWRSRAVRRLVFVEHAALAGWGLAVGGLAGVVAIIPSATSAQAPLGSLAGLFGLVAFSALTFTAVATKISLRGALLDALRNE